MLKNHSFSNPFTSVKDKFQKNGRSNSAPEAFDFYLAGIKPSCGGNASGLASVSEGSVEEESISDTVPEICHLENEAQE